MILTVVFLQWANNFKISDNENIKKTCTDKKTAMANVQ